MMATALMMLLLFMMVVIKLLLMMLLFLLLLMLLLMMMTMTTTTTTPTMIIMMMMISTTITLHRILVIGTSNGWFLRMTTRVHIDQIIIALSQNCPKLDRLEVQWDSDNIRYSDNSSKFIDQLRYYTSLTHPPTHSLFSIR